MEWKDTGENPSAAAQAGPTYDDAPLYNALDKRPGNRWLTAMIAGGVLALVVLVVGFVFSGRSGSEDQDAMLKLQSRLDQMEARLVKLEGLQTQLAAVEALDRKVETFNERLDRIEASTAQRLEQILASQQAAQKKTPPAPAVQAAKSPTQSRAKQVTVKKGETLFQISRTNGVSVEDLLRWNNLKSSTPIHPGQKLLVSKP